MKKTSPASGIDRTCLRYRQPIGAGPNQPYGAELRGDLPWVLLSPTHGTLTETRFIGPVHVCTVHRHLRPWLLFYGRPME